MQAIGYVRVSTGHQVDSGLSIEAQKVKLEAAAQLHDFNLVRIIEDAGASGKNLDRPGMTQLLGLIDTSHADVVIITKLDRITRSTADLAGLIERLHTARRADGARGVDLISTSESLDTTSAAGRLVVNILGSVAAWEREAIVERTKDALQQKRAQGMAAGNVPWGYSKLEDGRLIPNDTERRVLKEIKALRTDGVGWTEVALEITDRGHRTRRGSRWTRQGVTQIAQGNGIW